MLAGNKLGRGQAGGEVARLRCCKVAGGEILRFGVFEKNVKERV